MSTPLPPDSGVDPEPFRYGWRYDPRRQPDGTETVDRVPLTLLDILHPQEGDQIPENSRHEGLRRHFQNVFQNRLARQPTLLSLSDCLIDWDRPDLRGHCPDLIVLERDEPWPWHSWSTLHVEEEQARPLLVIEITSPHTRSNDVVDKVEHYHRAGVPLYVIVDEEQDEGPLSLIGYRYGPRGYVPIPLDEQRRLHLGPFALYLEVIGERVALFDAVTGKELGDYTAVCDALEAETRARKAAERRERKQTKARRAAERNAQEQTAARQAAEQARQAAEQARQAAQRRQREEVKARKAAEQRQRQEAEARAASDKAQAELVARLQQMEEELRRLRGS
jgi:hypothetical protein